jgi:hypothetical protein
LKTFAPPQLCPYSYLSTLQGTKLCLITVEINLERKLKRKRERVERRREEIKLFSKLCTVNSNMKYCKRNEFFSDHS